MFSTQKLQLLLALSLFFLFSAPLFAQHKFVSKEGRCKINFFGKPHESEQELANGGILKLYIHSVGENEAYMLSYAILGEDIQSGMEKMLLESAKGGIIQSSGARIESEKIVQKQKKYEGISLKAYTASEQLYFVYEIYIKDNILYQVGIIRKGDYPSKKQVKKFVNSFRILD